MGYLSTHEPLGLVIWVGGKDHIRTGVKGSGRTKEGGGGREQDHYLLWHSAIIVNNISPTKEVCMIPCHILQECKWWVKAAKSLDLCLCSSLHLIKLIPSHRQALGFWLSDCSSSLSITPFYGWSLVYSLSNTAMLRGITKGRVIWESTNLQLII